MANQPTAEQLKAMQEMANRQFMALSYEQTILANAQNGNSYAQARTLNFDAPIIAGAYATKVTLRHKLTVNWNGTGTVALNAAYPYSFVQEVGVTFGNRQVTVSPYVAKINDMIEGYARTQGDASKNFVSTAIQNMLHKVPTALANGDNVITFDTDIPLNFLHEQSVNGIIPISSSGTRLQIALQTANAVAGVDPLENVFKTSGGAVVAVTGSVDVVITFRDYNSMTTRQPLEPNLAGLPTVQVIQLPTVTPLTNNTMQYLSFRNPYPFAKLFHIVIDGKQSDKFAAADNIVGFELAKAENSNSAWMKYDEKTIASYYKEVRSRFGTDLDEGVMVFDATTANLSNVSSKMGAAYLNLSGDGFPAARAGFKVAAVDNATITSRIVSFGVMLNPAGISAR